MTTGYSFSRKPERDRELSELDPEGVFWKSIEMQDSSGESEDYWHLFVSCGKWQVGVFDSILRRVADDRISNVFMTGVREGAPWLFHPYDGGADVVLPNTSSRDELEQRYRDWLSSHPEGL